MMMWLGMLARLGVNLSCLNLHQWGTVEACVGWRDRKAFDGVVSFSTLNHGLEARNSWPNGLQMRKDFPWHAWVSWPIIPHR